MLPNAPSLSGYVSRCWFPSRSSFRQRALSLPWLRVICLGTGLWFAWGSITAELMMAEVYHNRSPTAKWAWDLSDAAVARFPFDPYLRGARDYVHQRILQQLEADHAK